MSLLASQMTHGMETILASRYQIVRHLGGGGFGQTFLAQDSHLPGKPICVVKQLKPKVNDPSTFETAKRLFDREAETLYRLGSHDQIPRLLAHFEQDKEFYLVQEFIEGRPLDLELTVGKQFDETTVIALLQDVLQVLAFVHQQNVIHRDIKPANLIRRHRDSKIVLIDFGAVKQMNQPAINPTGQTSFTIAIGSPGYMPIEQQSFKPHYSSDIYAVGIVCLRALTGVHAQQLPRDPKTDEITCELLKDRIAISPGLAAILDRMVRYDYRQRYENAMEALIALQHYIGSADVDVQTATLWASDATATLSLTVPPPHQQTHQPSQPTNQQVLTNPVNPSTSQLQGMATDRRKQLERLLAEVIGPIAGLLLKQVLMHASTTQDLIERLAIHVPEEGQAQFRKRASALLKDVDSSPSASTKSQNVSTTPQISGAKSKPESMLDPAFVKQCEQELAQAIGPIAPFIVQKTLSKKPNLSPGQLVEALTQHLPSPDKAAAFRKALKVVD
jgi:serine/threonine protein kinase